MIDNRGRHARHVLAMIDSVGDPLTFRCLSVIQGDDRPPCLNSPLPIGSSPSGNSYTLSAESRMRGADRAHLSRSSWCSGPIAMKPPPGKSKMISLVHASSRGEREKKSIHAIGFVYSEPGGRASSSLRTTGTRGREKYVMARSC